MVVLVLFCCLVVSAVSCAANSLMPKLDVKIEKSFIMLMQLH